ncbi:SEL1-like repeat protein [Kiloniella laminariae]|uniref:SEL1-like repeat protein n=1 Tax=Kiloniella laminariae TaxID=454162 RepID=A0ABT4LIP0_9PROT|nr:SEL1-like repeat protein [Kiloniella laminariae]MCZ4280972.1 SEL1-like repeat protein [Kiloniella laminariae]
MKTFRQLCATAVMILGILLVSFPASAQNFEEAMGHFENGDYAVAYQGFSASAATGHRDAQFMLGYVYSKGFGAPQDYVEAHKWFNLAAAQGDREAGRARDKLVAAMTAEQVSLAQKLAQEWKAVTLDEAGKSSKNTDTAATTEDEPVLVWSAPPGESTPLDREEKRTLQSLLKALGYDPGPLDGLPGDRTRQAIRSYQADFGLEIDGLVQRALLDELRSRNQGKISSETEVPSSSKATFEAVDKEKILVDQLRKLVNDGSKTALPEEVYQQRISALLQEYDRPWSLRVFFDNFIDGDFVQNPEWSVESGDFEVRSRDYLFTSVPVPRTSSSSGETSTGEKSTTQKAVGLFSGIFSKALQPEERVGQYTGYAEIYNASPIPGSFSVRINLNGLLDGGRLVTGVYQGGARINGYKLAYQTGATSRIELLATTSSGQETIGSIALAESLTGIGHSLEFNRNREGLMDVVLDDQKLFSVTDTRLAGDFDGLLIGNHAGDFRIVEIEVYGEP